MISASIKRSYDSDTNQIKEKLLAVMLTTPRTI